MKRTGLVTLIAALLCLCLCGTLASCVKEEDVYTKTDVDSIITKLEAEISVKAAENEAAIDTLRSQYNAKIAELEAQNAENKTAIEALTNAYNTKVTELENKDKGKKC